MQHEQHIRRLAGLAVVVLVLALAGTAAAGLSKRESAAVAPTGISIVGWDAERGGTAVWRGVAKLREERFLRRARIPALSPTAGGVAYITYTRAGFDVYLTGTYGGFEQRLAQVAGPRATSLAFSPDGQQIAFSSARGIETVSIRGVRRVVPLPAAWRGSTYHGLAFSRDGDWLAFSRTWGDGRAGTLRNELALVRRDGRGARSLVRNPDPFGAQYRPTFSPDGTSIAFPAADGSLASVAVAGGAVTRLTSPPARRGAWSDANPVYSPDGSVVAFVRRPDRGVADVHLVGARGGEVRRLTTTPLPEPGQPRTGSTPLAFSPDGKRVLAHRRDEFAAVDVETGASTSLGPAATAVELGRAYWNR